jgi:hypothetical protein
MQPIETLPIDRWEGPFDSQLRRQAVAALETGCVLFCPRLAFALETAEHQLLASASADVHAKNISYDPATGRCKGAALGEAAVALAAVLRRFGDQAQALLTGLAPFYAPGMERARASFRPIEIAGRALPWRKDDRRLHVDAFPSRPARGRRILRVFSNADPGGAPRSWRIGEPFEPHAIRFLPRVRGPLPGQAALLALLGVTHGMRSDYDHFMLGLHDAAKHDAAYQAEAPATNIDFPAGSSWVVFTDQVPHAALGGRWAFEQTFHLDPAVMAQPELAPLAVLRRLTRRQLVEAA